MSDLKPALDSLLVASVQQSGWQPALKPALAGLDATQAAWRPAAERNSIHMIVRHLNLWKAAVLADLRSELPDLRAVAASDWQVLEADAELWASDLAEVDRLAQELQAATESDLERELPAFGTPLGLTLMLVASHDAYHSGQIVYLRKLQGV